MTTWASVTNKVLALREHLIAGSMHLCARPQRLDRETAVADRRFCD